VRAAHRFAMANPLIRGDMVEVSEYPYLVVKYGVQGVPQTIINESTSLVGAQPEMNVVQAVLKAIGK
jgi:predicted DsbA family dithiol-disulfide isomerase